VCELVGIHFALEIALGHEPIALFFGPKSDQKIVTFEPPFLSPNATIEGERGSTGKRSLSILPGHTHRLPYTLDVSESGVEISSHEFSSQETRNFFGPHKDKNLEAKGVVNFVKQTLKRNNRRVENRKLDHQY